MQSHEHESNTKSRRADQLPIQQLWDAIRIYWFLKEAGATEQELVEKTGFRPNAIQALNRSRLRPNRIGCN